MRDWTDSTQDWDEWEAEVLELADLEVQASEEYHEKSNRDLEAWCMKLEQAERDAAT